MRKLCCGWCGEEITPYPHVCSFSRIGTCLSCGVRVAKGEQHDCPRLRDEVAANALARVETVAEILNETTTTNGQDQEAGDDET